MPDSQQPNTSQESNVHLSAFQRYLLEERHLAEQYQKVIDGFVTECKTQNPGISVEAQRALSHYFTTYITRGANPALINFKDLSSKSPDEIKTLEENISDKLTPASRDRFARLGSERAKSAQWDELFSEGDDLVIPLAGDAKSIRERIDDVIVAHNAEADKRYLEALEGAAKDRGITSAELQNKITTLQKTLQDNPKAQISPEDRSLLKIGKDPSQIRVRIKEGSEQLDEYDRKNDKWKSGRKQLSGFLHQGKHEDLLDEYNNLGTSMESRQAAMQAATRTVNKTPVPYGEIGTKADGYNPDSMHIVISRDPQRIGESSSGQAWFSCMSENGINFPYLDADIKQGTVVAYLTAKDDPLVRRPLARVLLKPYTNAETGETILVPGKVYGGVDDYTQGRRETLSPKVKAALQEGGMEWARQSTHLGKTGTFEIRTGLYADGELTIQTLRDKWAPGDISDGIKGFRLGSIQEFLTEHYHVQSTVDEMPAGEEKAVRQKELNTEYTRKMAQFEDSTAMAKAYLKKLEKSSLGAIPTLEQVTDAVKEMELSRKVALESLGTANPDLVMKYSLFEQRAGNAPDEAFVGQAIQQKPELAFDSSYRDVVMGKAWSEQLVAAAAKAKPDDDLLKDLQADLDDEFMKFVKQENARTNPKATQEEMQRRAAAGEMSPAWNEAREKQRAKGNAPDQSVADDASHGRTAGNKELLQEVRDRLHEAAGIIAADQQQKIPSEQFKPVAPEASSPTERRQLSKNEREILEYVKESNAREKIIFGDHSPTQQNITSGMFVKKTTPGIVIECKDGEDVGKVKAALQESIGANADGKFPLKIRGNRIEITDPSLVLQCSSLQEAYKHASVEQWWSYDNLTSMESPFTPHATPEKMAVPNGARFVQIEPVRNSKSSYAPSMGKFHISVDPAQLPQAWNAIAEQLVNSDMNLSMKVTRPEQVGGAIAADKNIVIYYNRRSGTDKNVQEWNDLLSGVEKNLRDNGIRPGPTIGGDHKFSEFVYAREGDTFYQTAGPNKGEVTNPYILQEGSFLSKISLKDSAPSSQIQQQQQQQARPDDPLAAKMQRQWQQQRQEKDEVRSQEGQSQQSQLTPSKKPNSAQHPNLLWIESQDGTMKIFAPGYEKGSPTPTAWLEADATRLPDVHEGGEMNGLNILQVKPGSKPGTFLVEANLSDQISVNNFNALSQGHFKERVQALRDVMDFQDASRKALYDPEVNRPAVADAHNRLYSEMTDAIGAWRVAENNLKDPQYGVTAAQVENLKKIAEAKQTEYTDFQDVLRDAHLRRRGFEPINPVEVLKNHQQTRPEAQQHTAAEEASHAVGKVHGLAGAIVRLKDMQEHGVQPLDGAALGLDAAGFLTKGEASAKFGTAGQLAGIASQTYKGYQEDGVKGAVREGGKGTLNAVVAGEVLGAKDGVAIGKTTLEGIKVVPKLFGATKQVLTTGIEAKKIYTATKEGIIAVKTAATVGNALAKGKQLLGMANMANAGAVANFAGKMALINSAMGVASDTIDYATGKKELNMDNWGGTATDAVTNMDPLKAVTFGKVTVEGGVNRVEGMLGLTDGKSSIAEMRAETMKHYADIANSYKPGMFDVSLRHVDPQDASKPLLSDYKHLAAVRGQIQQCLPDGKIDGKDIETQFTDIDMSKFENYTAYSRAFQMADFKQNQVMEENANSYIPRWMRFGSSANKYNAAEENAALFKSAHEEFTDYETRLAAYNKGKAEQAAQIDNLLNSKDAQVIKDRDAIFERAAMGNVTIDHKKADLDRLTKLMGGNSVLAQSIIERVTEQGAKQRAEQAVAEDKVQAVDKLLQDSGVTAINDKIKLDKDQLDLSAYAENINGHLVFTEKSVQHMREDADKLKKTPESIGDAARNMKNADGTRKFSDKEVSNLVKNMQDGSTLVAKALNEVAADLEAHKNGQAQQAQASFPAHPEEAKESPQKNNVSFRGISADDVKNLARDSNVAKLRKPDEIAPQAVTLAPPTLSDGAINRGNKTV